jgi:hypothetical protein
MKGRMIVVIIVLSLGLGFLLGFITCNESKVRPLEAIIKEAREETEELKLEILRLAEKREEEVREKINEMDPDTVIDTYLNDAVLERITEGADTYTRRIIEEVFRAIKSIIREYSKNSS